MADIERRVVSEGLEIRSTEGGGRTLVGYAAIFDTPSEPLGPRGAKFREIIKPGAFDRAMKEGHDVRALVNHESGMILGRTKSGTLRLSVDSRGLKYEVDLPDTTAARDLSESIKRGDISGSSFGFSVPKGGDDWVRGEQKDVAYRHVLDLDLLDVSPVTYPAYPETQVSLRALERAKEEAEKAEEPPPEPPAPVERIKREIDHLARL